MSSKDTNEEFKNFIDVEDIKSKRALKTGIVASYNIYPSYTELKEYDGNMTNTLKI
ncbi:hypothetical protein H477_1858 [[Clostridium] sordellii ATCC 9714]|nr:hypothetical protein H477_1858 [[Clostridium] sordellii ATCC 9714] [Paeniclostridium sordellii ATCC 9714]